jgi:hypothetical protein
MSLRYPPMAKMSLTTRTTISLPYTGASVSKRSGRRLDPAVEGTACREPVMGANVGRHSEALPRLVPRSFSLVGAVADIPIARTS